MSAGPEVSLCDTCRRPGACCTGFSIFGRDRVGQFRTALDIYVAFATVEHAGGPDKRGGIGVPFMPLWWKGRVGSMTEWSLWCPLLTPEGRCGDYENRPEPCWRFEPGSPLLCVEFRPTSSPEDCLKADE